MERLTNIGSNGEIWITDNDKTRRLGREESAYNKLAEYEDLEEQGLLLRLPCRVGSTLYQPISNRINEYKAIGLCFDITRNEFMYEVAYQIGLEWHKTTCDFDCINKTVFLTKEEAEQKLKEMESENDEKTM